MKVIKVASFGTAEGLVLQEVPDIKPDVNQVIIDVEAAGVGYVDVLARKGFLPGLSDPGFIPGAEVAGIVIKVGEAVDKSWIGQRVFAITSIGGYAEEVAVDVASIVRIPVGINALEAVALGINALVAEFSLERAACKASQKVLIRGSGGGIGLLSVQLALLRGATVTALTSSTQKQQRLEALSVRNFIRSCHESTETFDVIIDPVAGPQTGDFINKLNLNGHYILNGAAAGFPNPDFGYSLVANFQKSPTISCVSLTSLDPSILTSKMEYLFSLAAKGELIPVVANTYSLSEAVEAHRYLESGESFGKIVLRN